MPPEMRQHIYSLLDCRSALSLSHSNSYFYAERPYANLPLEDRVIFVLQSQTSWDIRHRNSNCKFLACFSCMRIFADTSFSHEMRTDGYAKCMIVLDGPSSAPRDDRDPAITKGEWEFERWCKKCGPTSASQSDRTFQIAKIWLKWRGLEASEWLRSTHGRPSRRVEPRPQIRPPAAKERRKPGDTVSNVGSPQFEVSGRYYRGRIIRRKRSRGSWRYESVPISNQGSIVEDTDRRQGVSRLKPSTSFDELREKYRGKGLTPVV